LVVEGAEAEFLAGVRVGLGVILRAPGCVHATVFRGVEQPREFRLVIEWRDVAAHEAFRSSPQFGEYRSTIGQFLDGTPTHSHFTREIEMATAQGDDA
jgi:quinol monooxygenase YgiN